MDRAYSILNIKAVDEEQRIIRGVATTPDTDRVGDIVVSTGVKFKNPSPLLWQHQSDKPVGTVKFDRPTESGITFEARLPKIAEPGVLKDRVDEAWQSVREKLVTAVSIGFRVLDDGYEVMKNGGIKFLKTEVMELSLVTIPANSSATITQIKSIDSELLAASGREQRRAVRLDPSPGVSGTKQQPAKSGFFYARNEGNEVKTIAEQITDLENTRASKAARMTEVMQKSLAEGRSTDAAEGEEFDTIEAELKTIDSDLVRLKKLESMNIQKATPVNGASNQAAASGARAGVVVKNTQKLEPGIPLARYARCLLLAEGNKMHASQIAKNQYPEMDWLNGVFDAEVAGINKAQAMLTTKAAVAGGNTTDATWASPLVQYQQYAGDFVEFLRPQMIVGKFGTAGIPALRRVPFNVTISGQTSGGNAGWVGEAAPKPLTKFDFANVNLRWAKIAAISVISEELARMSSPSAEALIRDSLAAAVIARADFDFIDPDKAAVTNVSPASIINGVTPVTSTGGNSAAEIRADIRALFASWISNNVNPANAVFIMAPGTALALSLMYNDLDSARVFPNVAMNGGTLEGIPVIVSQYAAQVQDGGSSGSIVILANASDIYLADDGGVDIAVSREASLQMNDAPDNPATASTVFTSMFQTNQLAIRAEMYINWAKRRTNAVAWLDSVSWGT